MKGPIQQVSNPTGLAIQGFGTHGLGLPPLQQTPSAVPQTQSTNPVPGVSSSQLNKSAPPFKPASQQKQQQQSGSAQQIQPLPPSAGPTQQHSGSQPTTPAAQVTNYKWNICESVIMYLVG